MVESDWFFIRLWNSKLDIYEEVEAHIVGEDLGEVEIETRDGRKIRLEWCLKSKPDDNGNGGGQWD